MSLSPFPAHFPSTVHREQTNDRCSRNGALPCPDNRCVDLAKSAASFLLFRGRLRGSRKWVVEVRRRRAKPLGPLWGFALLLCVRDLIFI